MRVLLIFFCISPVRKANKLLNYCFKKIQIQFKVSCNLLQICTFARTQGGPAGSSNTALNNTRPHPSHNTNLQLTHTHTHRHIPLSLSLWRSIRGRRVCQLLILLWSRELWSVPQPRQSLLVSHVFTWTQSYLKFYNQTLCRCFVTIPANPCLSVQVHVERRSLKLI